MYVVLNRFDDLQDKKHSYQEGDLFPYNKKIIEQERLEELMGNENKLKKPLIKEISIDEMNEIQLVELAKIEGIYIKELILERIQNETDKKEIKKLKTQAKKLKISYSDDITIEELKKMIEETENVK